MLPSIYLWALGGIMLLSLVLVRAFGGPLRAMRPYADLFFMGAAFLLLETKNIATFANLFGTTWIVNAMVFGGVLLIVLAAVETTRRFRTPPLPVVFAVIAASLALAYAVKPEWLLTLAFWPRLMVAVLLAFIPIYLANIAFAKRFAVSGDSQAAFGDQPARRDGRRLPGVRRAAHRLPQPAGAGGGALPRGVPAQATRDRCHSVSRRSSGAERPCPGGPQSALFRGSPGSSSR